MDIYGMDDYVQYMHVYISLQYCIYSMEDVF